MQKISRRQLLQGISAALFVVPLVRAQSGQINHGELLEVHGQKLFPVYGPEGGIAVLAVAVEILDQDTQKCRYLKAENVSGKIEFTAASEPFCFNDGPAILPAWMGASR